MLKSHLAIAFVVSLSLGSVGCVGQDDDVRTFDSPETFEEVNTARAELKADDDCSCAAGEGDIDGDGDVDLIDVKLLARHLRDGHPICGGDVNKDGDVDLQDLASLVDSLFNSSPPKPKCF